MTTPTPPSDLIARAKRDVKGALIGCRKCQEADGKPTDWDELAGAATQAAYAVVRERIEWQLIETAPLETRIMLWCPERQRKGEAPCFVFGSVVKFSDGTRVVYGDGMNGDWLFTHWMPLPDPPSNKGLIHDDD